MLVTFEVTVIKLLKSENIYTCILCTLNINDVKQSPLYKIWTKLNKILPESLFPKPTSGWVGLSKKCRHRRKYTYFCSNDARWHEQDYIQPPYHHSIYCRHRSDGPHLCQDVRLNAYANLKHLINPNWSDDPSWRTNIYICILCTLHISNVKQYPSYKIWTKLNKILPESLFSNPT